MVVLAVAIVVALGAALAAPAGAAPEDDFYLWTPVSGCGAVMAVPLKQDYLPGDRVTVTATPLPGWHFIGWSGDTVTTATTLHLTFTDHDIFIVAEFERDYTTYTLTLNAVGAGSVSRDPAGAGRFGPLSPFALQATPDPGATFLGWNGDTASGTPYFEIVTRAADMVVEGHFSNPGAVTWPLATDVIGNGRIRRVPDLARFVEGAVVELTAEPGPGWVFAGWSGDATGAANPTPVTMSASRAVTATFTRVDYLLTSTATGPGTVARSPDQPAYPLGTPVTLAAAPHAGATFVRWEGDTSSIANPLVVPVNRDRVVRAVFAYDTYPVEVSTAGNGTVAATPEILPPSGPLLVAHGSPIILTAFPTATPAAGPWGGAGQAFVRWEGDTTATDNPLVLTVTRPRTLRAVFTYDANVTIAGNGVVTRFPDLPAYPPGETLLLTAWPGPGESFLGWLGDTTASSPSLQITMNRNWSVLASFTAPSFPLTVNKVGHGSVTKSPDVVDHPFGTIVTLRANPSPGHHFVRWEGDLSSTDDVVAVSMTRPLTITAVFSMTAIATSVGNGNVTRVPASSVYEPGTLVTFTANPSAGHAFVGWAGDTTTLTNPLALVLTRNRSLQARFTWGLKLTINGSGAVTRAPNKTVFAPGEAVSLTAVPAPGMSFLNWSGDTVATANPLTLVMSRDRTIVANFTSPPLYNLIVTVDGAGAVTWDPPGVAYVAGTVVTVTATPNPGHSFLGWEGDTTSSADALILTMTRPRTLRARFTYSLSATATSGGLVTKVPDQVAYASGTPVQVTAVPNTGYVFTSWTGDTAATANPLNLVMTRNRSLIGGFAPILHALTTTFDGEGTVSRSPSQASYAHGTVVTLTATPSAGHTFLGWDGDTATTTNPLAITMTRARTLRARFTYRLTATISGSGAVAKNPDQVAYLPGTSVTLTATPAPGSTFIRWTGDTSTTVNPLTIVMTRSRGVIANFQLVTYTLTTEADGAGTVTRSPNLGLYAYGTVVTVTATPSAGQMFLGWEGDTVTTGNPLVLTMTRNRSLRARFTYSVSLTVSGPGTAVKVPDQTAYLPGTELQLTATPAAGAQFINWTGDTTTTTNPLGLVLTRNRTLRANFQNVMYPLAITVSGSGSVSRSPNAPSYPPGTVVTLTASPTSGNAFRGWGGDTTTTNTVLTVTMTGPKTYSATFTYRLTTNVLGNGTVSATPPGPVYDPGTMVGLEALPDPGNVFRRWTGAVSSTANPVSVLMNANKSVTAEFAMPTYELHVVISGCGEVTPSGGSYPAGTHLSLNATPLEGWRFLFWGETDGSSHFQNPLPIEITGERWIYPYFEEILTSTVVVSANVVGPGAVEANPSFGVPLRPGSLIEMVATPEPGGAFMGWSGDTTRHERVWSMVVWRDMTLDAYFCPPGDVVRDLATHVEGEGRIERTPDLGHYLDGSVTTLTAKPAPGWALWRWSGDASGSRPSVDLAMNGDRAVTAVFRPIPAGATALEDGATPVVTSFALAAPAPNPGHDAALAFDAPREADARLSVVDVNGRLVRALVRARVGPGRHTTRWAGEDASGRPAPPGLYFLRYEVEGKVFTRRFALAR